MILELMCRTVPPKVRIRCLRLCALTMPSSQRRRWSLRNSVCACAVCVQCSLALAQTMVFLSPARQPQIRRSRGPGRRARSRFHHESQQPRWWETGPRQRVFCAHSSLHTTPAFSSVASACAPMARERAVVLQGDRTSGARRPDW